MTTSTGLFQFSPFQSEQVVPAYAELEKDPLGQVAADITAYLPEGTGSSGYDWQKTAHLRVDFAREKVELVWTDEGQYHIEGEWHFDASDEDAREDLLLLGTEEPDLDTFAVLAGLAPTLAISPPEPSIREFWGEDRAFAEGVPGEDWPGARDD